jgi:Ca2+-transporting ATPase
MFAAQFKDFLVIVLLFAAVISAGTTYLENLINPATASLPIDTIVILVIVVINAFMGFVQEYRAEKAIEALLQLTAPRAHLIRNGEPVEVSAREVVPGDILRLETGDRLPADARLIESSNLYSDEASLTGESLPAKKNASATLEANAPVGDRQNMVYSSTVITSGRGLAVVCRTGMGTEIGRVAEMIHHAEEKETPLQRRMEHLGKQLGGAILIICFIVFGVQVWVKYLTASLAPRTVLDLFMVAVALAVAAIPEGLPAVVTITLALGVQRMIKRNAIIRRLPAVETLGSANIICSDKTGTLTKDEMTVRLLYVPNRTIQVTGVGYDPQGEFLLGDSPVNPTEDAQLSLLLRIGRLCGNATVHKGQKGWEVLGDPTEAALVVVSDKAGLDNHLLDRYPRIAELPFDAGRKRMATLHDTPEGEEVAYVKGAPEVLLKLSTHVLTADGSRRLTGRDRKAIMASNDLMASDALRVLAMAYRVIPQTLGDISPEGVEKQLTFVGLVGMMDPPRPEVREAVRQSHEAGITPVMITGDNILTAVAVAKELGMFKPKDLVLTGQELDSLSDKALAKIAPRVRVYARVSPEHKLRIIKALRKRGYVAAMTGDGVNDAPALKSSDIGVAMGITGTDVAKEAADMVLADDNFASIVSAVEEGRGIADNTRKFISFLLSCNAGEILTLFLASILFIWWPLPLIAIQILFVNLITDGLPALALGVDPIEAGAMRHPPRDPKEGVITRRVWVRILAVGMTIAVVTLLAYWWEIAVVGGGVTSDETVVMRARTVAFTVMVMMELFHAFNSRSDRRSLFSVGFTRNRALLASIAVSVGLQLAILYVYPLAQVFQVTALSLLDWVVIVLASLSIFIVVEIIKLIDRRTSARPTAGMPIP